MFNKVTEVLSSLQNHEKKGSVLLQAVGKDAHILADNIDRDGCGSSG